MAQEIGRSSAMGAAIRDIVRSAKEPAGGEALGSPVVLIGHSMGAMILQTSFDSLLERAELGATEASDAEKRRCTRVQQGNRAIGGFPDLVLLLNSATDSQITRGLVEKVQARGLSKIVDCGGERFEAPLFISASSKNDYATTWLFWAAKLGRKVTDGNDDDLINYRLAPAGAYRCPPIPGLRDFKQSWHCLRPPAIRSGRMAEISIDLPQAGHERERDECHLRYRMENTAGTGAYAPLWVFQVPGELIEEHGDIFNGRSNLLMMALIQVSGATMSVFNSYPGMFEPDIGVCAAARPAPG
jgi:hypothetical protein